MDFPSDTSSQINQLNLQMCSMRATIDSMQKSMSPGTRMIGGGGGGASYTRWGKKSCPSGSELVYEGEQLHDDKGGQLPRLRYLH